MIKLKKEPADLFKKFQVYEYCYFCGIPTEYWNISVGKPICKDCSRTHKLSEIKIKFVAKNRLSLLAKKYVMENEKLTPAEIKIIWKNSKEEILTNVCSQFNADKDIIVTKMRIRKYVEIRYLFWFLMKNKHPKITTAYLGRIFEKDHATVCYGLGKICDWLETSKIFRANVGVYYDVDELIEESYSWRND